MKILAFKKHILKVAFLLTAVITLASCGKDKDGPEANGYPKEVTIEYRVKATAGNLTAADLLYANETDGYVNLDNATLPFSVKFKRTVKFSEAATISVTSSVGGGLETEILVNDKSVSKKTFSGTSVITGSDVYLFQ
jgi:hypothetical protein